MKDSRSRRCLFITAIIAVTLFCLTGLQKTAFAKVEWEVLQNLALDDTPLDIVTLQDNAYILGSKKVLIYSIRENKITDTIPIEGNFSRIAIYSDGEALFLTDPESKQLSIIKLSTVYDLETGQSPVIGKSEAPVSLVAFLDYQCPYCANIYPVLEQLLNKYPKDVNLVIKQYPLRMHSFAKKASMAALAASRQNKYAEITKSFFSNYKSLNDETIKKYTEETGLDMKKFEADYNSPSIQTIINEDTKLAAQAKVRGVPALFINGRVVTNRSLEALSSMVEGELKKKK